MTREKIAAGQNLMNQIKVLGEAATMLKNYSDEFTSDASVNDFNPDRFSEPSLANAFKFLLPSEKRIILQAMHKVMSAKQAKLESELEAL